MIASGVVLSLTFLVVGNVGALPPLPLFTATVGFGGARTTEPCFVQNCFFFLDPHFAGFFLFLCFANKIFRDQRKLLQLIDFDSLVCLLSS